MSEEPGSSGQSERFEDALDVPADAGGGGVADLLGGMDMSALMGAARSMQEQIFEAQRQAATATVEGTAGGGLVRIEADGSLAFTAVHISPDAVDPDDPTLLEDLVLAALHDVVASIEQLHAAANPLAGIDLGDLGGLLGGD